MNQTVIVLDEFLMKDLILDENQTDQEYNTDEPRNKWNAIIEILQQYIYITMFHLIFVSAVLIFVSALL